MAPGGAGEGSHAEVMRSCRDVLTGCDALEASLDGGKPIDRSEVRVFVAIVRATANLALELAMGTAREAMRGAVSAMVTNLGLPK
jgi:hypothetical protein